MKSEKWSTNQQKVAFVSGIIMILVNVAALAWNIHQTSMQNTETKKLTVLTAELDDRVNRLAANLDQRVSRLNRQNELVSRVFQSSLTLNQRMQQGKEMDKGVQDTEGFEAGSVSIEEITVLNVNVETLGIEMIAIARASGDGELLSLTNQYWQTMPFPEQFTTHEDWLERLAAFRSAAITLHERVYQLLEKATQID